MLFVNDYKITINSIVFYTVYSYTVYIIDFLEQGSKNKKPVPRKYTPQTRIISGFLFNSNFLEHGTHWGVS